MKEIKSKTSSAKKTLVPWFETMGKQVGLSQETISAVLKEQRLRIRKLNYASAYTVSNILIQDCGGADDMWSNYAKLALILERCKYTLREQGLCILFYRSAITLSGVDVTGEYALYQLPELFLDFLETNDKNSSYHWDYNKLVERHEDAQARSFG